MNYLRNKILDYLSVEYYDSFERPKPWYTGEGNWGIHTTESIEEYNRNIDWIDRIRFKNQIAKEYQYSNDFITIQIKETEIGELEFKFKGCFFVDEYEDFWPLIFSSKNFYKWYL